MSRFRSCRAFRALRGGADSARSSTSGVHVTSGAIALDRCSRGLAEAQPGACPSIARSAGCCVTVASMSSTCAPWTRWATSPPRRSASGSAERRLRWVGTGEGKALRLGVAWTPGQNAQYRAFQPMRAMIRRGHEVIWPPTENGEVDPRRLAGCDLVHIFRRSEPDTWQAVSSLMRAGMPMTFDNDDDLTAVPRQRRSAIASQRHFAATVRMGRAARVLTTTNDVLAEKYRRAGVERVEVIGNYLVPDVARPRHPHRGVVVGWVAGVEHKSDADALAIAATLKRLVAEHPDVSVECIGVDLKLPVRYRHDRHVAFEEVPDRLGGFDIGIAPLADTAFNRARSDIKLKEYAASGVVWLASPVGPYRQLGETQGGRLVPDDGWYAALERLVVEERARTELARRGRAWAQRQTID